jgi:SWIM zinc finger
MTQSPLCSLVLTALTDIRPDRLQKAVCGLADGSLNVTIARQSAAAIRATVANGGGAEYAVAITPSGAACTCGDATYRKAACKHILAVALRVLGQAEARAGEADLPIHLALKAGAPALCGTVDPARVWTWPHWPRTEWAEACPECGALRTGPAAAAA